MKRLTWLTLAAAVVVAACSDATGRVALSVGSRPAATVGPSAPFSAMFVGAAPTVTTSGANLKISLGSDSIIVSSAALVLRKVELKKASVASCDAVPGTDDCEEFETGATLVSLPLGSAPTDAVVTISAPAGTYDAVEYEIHKPSSTEDAAFVAANPTFDGVSIRVAGTYYQGTSAGTAFTFTSDVDQSVESSLVPPKSVTDGATLDITLRVDISSWFVNQGGTLLIDPNSANKGQPNESIVANNIQNSFKAFEDANHDCQEDH